MNDERVIERTARLSARELLDQFGAAPTMPPEPPAAPSEGDDPLPSPDAPYRAHARPSVRPEAMLGLLARTVPFEAFAYHDLHRIRLAHPGAAAAAPVLVLRFGMGEATEVVIEGRNLLPLADYLRQQRIAWIRECPSVQDPGEPNAVRVTRITVKEPEEG